MRPLFCLFADDTSIFSPAQAFRDFVRERTAPDGSDLGPRLAQLFQVLNKPWMALARLVSPARVAERHRGWVAFFITAVLYMAVTLAKIEHCISAEMVGCR